MSQHFPDNFLWGASSSAFQIEGGWDEDGKGMTVADYNSFKRSAKQADSKVASDFYHHWKEDIDLMKEMGMKAYRFSLSWARIIPDGDGEVNQKGIDFYNQVIDYLIENGIQPLVTLYHFDLPYALVEKYNGWECRDCAFAFERYARVCYKAFGDRVKYWQMINEQNLMIRVNERMNIYVEDDWEADRMRAQMDYHMFLGHALAVNACHELVEGGKAAPAVSSTCTYPLTNKPEDVWAAKMNDWLKTNYCLEMHINGEYPGYYMRYLKERNIVPKMEEGDKEILKSAKIDYIALNYYRPFAPAICRRTRSIRLAPESSGATRWISTSTATAGTRRTRTSKQRVRRADRPHGASDRAQRVLPPLPSAAYHHGERPGHGGRADGGRKSSRRLPHRLSAQPCEGHRGFH